MTRAALAGLRAARLRAAAAVGGLAALACAWLTPLPAWLPGPFSAHMATHMTVVAVAAPLLAYALSGGALDPLRRLPAPMLAVPASLVELLVVWGWHAPALHHLAHRGGAAFAAEQATFMLSALAVWLSACATDGERRPGGGYRGYEGGSSHGAGIVALLLTSMHMTLLGALLALAPRPLYRDATLGALEDQQLGGALMLAVGGAVYLFGGLALAAGLLRSAAPPSIAPAQPGSPP